MALPTQFRQAVDEANQLQTPLPEIEDIKQDSTSLAGGAEPKEVGVISNTPVIEEFQDNSVKIDKLKSQILDTQAKILQKQQQLSAIKEKDIAKADAKREADLQAKLESEAAGLATEEDPELTKLKTESDNLTSDAQNVQNQLDQMALAMDVASQNIINSIKQTFDAREASLVDSNKRAEQQITTFGTRFGLNRYSPVTFAGLISSQEKAGIQAIANLNAQEAQLIAEATQARDANKFDILRDKLDRIETNKDKKAKEIADLQKVTQERNEEVQEEVERIAKETAIVDLVSQGIMDTGDIFEATGGLVSLEEIESAKDALLESETTAFEEVIDRFNDAEGNRVLVVRDKRTGDVKNLKVGLVDAGGGIDAGDEVLSVNEASSLGVPFGTTKSEAFGIQPKEKLTGVEKFRAETQLAKEFESSVGPSRKVLQQVKLIKSSLESARKAIAEGESINAASQGVLVSFQKVLDPTSVVRESEYARSGTGLSLMGRLEGLVTKISKGGAGVSFRDLETFVETANNFLEGYQLTIINQAQRIQRVSERQGLDLPSILTSDVMKLLEQSEAGEFLSDEEKSLEELAKTKGFDIEAARASDATDEEIKTFLEQ